MESGLVVQLLILAGVLAYGVWGASKMGKKGGNKTGHRMPGGENFPFPKAAAIPSAQKKTVAEEEEPSAENDRLQYRNAVPTDFADRGAVASVTDSDEDNLGGEKDLLPEVEEKQSVVTDLRTIIISSELLKPKYEEY